MQISKDWTPEERLEVLSKIVDEMRQRGGCPSRADFAFLCDRLAFLAVGSPEFLEVNRENILGKEPEGEKR